MADYTYASNAAFVTGDGDYTENGELLIFNPDDLTEEHWAIISELPDSERIVFITAVLNGEDVTDYEEEYHGR